MFLTLYQQRTLAEFVYSMILYLVGAKKKQDVMCDLWIHEIFNCWSVGQASV